MVDYQTRQELNALSKEVFGSSSRWQKLVNNGVAKLVTEEVTELVPGETDDAPSTERKVQIPVKLNGMLHSVVQHHTVESVRELMVELKQKRDEYLAARKKAQEEEQAKKQAEALAKQVHEDLAGSAGL